MAIWRGWLKCAWSAPPLFSVPMRCCTLPSWSKINTWWTAAIADKHLAAAVAIDVSRVFQHILAERPHKAQRGVEHAHTLVVASHRQKDCQLRLRRLQVDGWSVFHRCQRHRFLQECGVARHCRRQTPAHGGCGGQQRKDEIGGRQPHPKDSSADWRLILHRCHRSYAYSLQKQDRVFERDSCCPRTLPEALDGWGTLWLGPTYSYQTVCAWKRSGRWAYCAGVGAWTRGKFGG